MNKNAISNTPPQKSTVRTFQTKFGRYKDLCDALGIGRTTLWRWSNQPGFPKPVKRGNTVLFDIAAVEAWLAEGNA